MLSFQRSSNHPSSMMPWFAQPISDPRTTTTTAPSFWLQMSDGSANPLADSTSSSSTGSSCATSTKVPPPLASSSSTNSQIHSFYPSQNDIKTKQTRSTLRTVNTSAELNLPLDPRSWLREDVQTWIRYMSEVHGLPAIDTDRFLMNGKALCLMTIEMFCQRVPLGGKMLYKDFQLRLSMAMYS